MRGLGISAPFHEMDPETWWREASEPVLAYYRALRAGGPAARPLPPALDDPADIAESAAACAAAAVARLAESILDDPPEAARLRIGGGAW
jgi:hypothetical protein